MIFNFLNAAYSVNDLAFDGGFIYMVDRYVHLFTDIEVPFLNCSPLEVWGALCIIAGLMKGIRLVLTGGATDEAQE